MMKKIAVLLALTLLSALPAHSALADVAVAVRAGTFGFGADFDIGLTNNLNLRLGYNTFSYSDSFEDTDVTYDGKLKIGAASAIFDWHAFGGGFRFSLGAVQKGPKIDVVGKPTGGTYELNGNIYSAAQIGSLSGKVELGDSVAPYIGIGWGNTVDKDGRVTFLFDVGAINTGSATASLNVNCGAVTVQTCSQIRRDLEAEKADLEDSASDYEWYPVIALGLAVRF